MERHRGARSITANAPRAEAPPCRRRSAARAEACIGLENGPEDLLMSSGEASTFNALRWPEGWGPHQVASSAVGRRVPHSRRPARPKPVRRSAARAEARRQFGRNARRASFYAPSARGCSGGRARRNACGRAAVGGTFVVMSASNVPCRGFGRWLPSLSP
jgi:hypothetical protein